jgi:hypothetical protein
MASLGKPREKQAPTKSPYWAPPPFSDLQETRKPLFVVEAELSLTLRRSIPRVRFMADNIRRWQPKYQAS